MKKLFAFVIALFLVLQAPLVLARSGDVKGTIYATDIKAYINGVEVPSYNIGGKTAFIIEDVLQKYCYHYRDDYRKLTWSISSPDDIIGGSNTSDKKPGTPVGKIYETDIETYTYDKLTPTFSLNGKMAVAIEEIAGDKVFSEIGARYFWDDKNRTISVEFIYDNSYDFLRLCNEKHLNADVKDGVLTLSSDPIRYGSMQSNLKNGIGEIYYNDALVGYSLKLPKYYFLYANDEECQFVRDDEPHGIIYWNMDAIEDALSGIKPAMPTREEQINHYLVDMGSFYDVKARLDTEDYTFLYLRLQGVMHGGSEFLFRISDDGEKVNYADEFESVSYGGGKFFDNTKLDSEERRFYFRYDKDYVIDLDSGVMTALE